MSFLKTINIQHLTSGTNNIVLDANGNMTCAGTISAATPTGGMRNKIINGDMRIDQRNAGAAVTATTSMPYSVDRWSVFGNQNSKFTIQQNAGSVTPPSGFVNYAGITSSSTYSVGASETFGLFQSVEGLNTSDLAWGTTSAKTITLSFWVRSSLTGIFGGALQNSSFDRAYPFTYRINTANTWEYETITIPGDTTGTWLTTNGIGLRLQFSVGSGSTVSTTAGAWTAGNYNSASGATSVVGTNGATFYITGVQLETGSVATAFERRQYGTELALCQRYYETGSAWFQGGGTPSSMGTSTSYAVPKRANPTIAFANVSYSSGSSLTNYTTSITAHDQKQSLAYYFVPSGGSAFVTFNYTSASEL